MLKHTVFKAINLRFFSHDSKRNKIVRSHSVKIATKKCCMVYFIQCIIPLSQLIKINENLRTYRRFLPRGTRARLGWQASYLFHQKNSIFWYFCIFFDIYVLYTHDPETITKLQCLTPLKICKHLCYF